MPRPMVPAPATPATRSLRLGSSKEVWRERGKLILSAGGGGGMKRVVVGPLLAALLLFAGAALGQAFPSKPVTLICPWPAGGTTDIYLRKVAELASKHLGQP